MNVCAPIVDASFHDIEGMSLQRKELSWNAIQRWKNLTCSVEVCSVTGQRLDDIVKTTDAERYKYEAVEVDKQFSGSSSTKLLSDSAKHVKVLRDMLHRLHEMVEYYDDNSLDNEVVGLLTLSMHFQLLRMGNLRGYVC